MKSSALPYWLTLAALLAALYGSYKWYQVATWQRTTQGGIDATEINLPPLTAFELTERSGKTFCSETMKGRVWVASFFFATCEGSCKRLNANIKYMTTLEDLRDVTWVSITVDPATDTVEKLNEYAAALNANPERWLFCRSDDFDYVQRLAADVLRVGGVSYKSHNDYAVIVDKNGKIAGMFNAGSNSESLKGIEVIKRCLEAEVQPRGNVASQEGLKASVPAPDAAKRQLGTAA